MKVPSAEYQLTIDKGLSIVKNIPFTRAVLLTGSLAEGRGTKKSDIDFFIQVKPGYIWTTRLLVTLVLQAVGLRRTDNDVAGKICLNWFATFNAPKNQKGRHFERLWQESKRSKLKSIFEFLVSIMILFGLEKITKKLQISRIERDSRTHEPASQVRYSDSELGFHPNKKPH